MFSLTNGCVSLCRQRSFADGASDAPLLRDSCAVVAGAYRRLLDIEFSPSVHSALLFDSLVLALEVLDLTVLVPRRGGRVIV